MRVAAIDIGTNSVHMIVVEVRADLSFQVIDREKEMVRLGAGGGAIESEEKAERGGGKSVQRGACTQPMAAQAAVISILWHTLTRKCRCGTPQNVSPFIPDRGAFAATPPGTNRTGGRLPQQQSLHRQG